MSENADTPASRTYRNGYGDLNEKIAELLIISSACSHSGGDIDLSHGWEATTDL